MKILNEEELLELFRTPIASVRGTSHSVNPPVLKSNSAQVSQGTLLRSHGGCRWQLEGSGDSPQ